MKKLRNLILVSGISIICLSAINAQTNNSKFPYPIIFVHGLVGEGDNYWTTIVSELGGDAKIFDVCLNHDGNLSTSILSNDVDIIGWRDSPQISSSNRLYIINFDNIEFHEPGHESHLQSNQSAIYKQGYALGKMIEQVRILENSDKVILVGHSMGGLAIREYLQRTENGVHEWWVDSDPSTGHKVAKAVTIGTPHRGSNLGTLATIIATRGIGVLIAWYKNIDVQGEAVRDLAWDYGNGLGVPGKYLYGGLENSPPYSYFHNSDINCDGDETDNIVRLNTSNDGTLENQFMSLPRNINYTWVISNYKVLGIGIGSDVVVDLDRQWLFYNRQPEPFGIADTILINSFHTDEPNDKVGILRGMDEPSTKSFAYEVDCNEYNQSSLKIYKGYTTYGTNQTSNDLDVYKFTAIRSGTLKLQFDQIYNSNSWSIRVEDSQGTVLSNISNPSSPVSEINVNKDETYYIYFTSQALKDSWKYNYQFFLIYKSALIPPGLTAGTSNPSSPTVNTIVEFSVVYTDKNNKAPSSVTCYINGSSKAMSKKDATNNNYASGVVYSYNQSFPQVGPNTYSFAAMDFDGKFFTTYPATGNLNLNVVQNVAGWDINATSVSVPTLPKPDQAFTINCTAVNNSNTPDKIYLNVPWTLEMISPSGAVVQSTSGTIPSITQGQTIPISKTFTAPTNEAVYQLIFTLLPSIDGNYANNSFARTLIISSAGPLLQWQVNPVDGWVLMRTVAPYNNKVFANSTWNYLGNNISSAKITRNSGSTIFSIDNEDFKTFDNNAIIIVNEAYNNLAENLMSFGTNATETVVFDQTNKTCLPGESVTFFGTANGTTFNGTPPDIYRNLTVSSWNSNQVWISDTQENYIFKVPSSAVPMVYDFFMGARVGGANGRFIRQMRITVLNPPPTITSIDKSQISSDDVITINGINFGSSGTISFGGINSTSALFWSNTSIQCVVPLGISTGSIQILNSYGASNAIPYAVLSSTGIPEIVFSIPTQNLSPGESKTIADLDDVFKDPNGTPLTFLINTNNDKITYDALVMSTDHLLKLIGASDLLTGSNISITATDASGKQISQTFRVDVPPILNISESYLSFPALGGTKIINVSSNITWTASTTDPFVSYTISGSELSISSLENQSVNSRSATIKIIGNGTENNVIIIQEGVIPILSVSSQNISILSASGSTGNFNINSNTSWIVTKDADWLNLSSTFGTGDRLFTVTAASDNPTTNPRSVSVTFSASGVNAVIVNITQDGTTQTLPVLSTSPISKTTITSAISGADITFDGGTAITEKGVCWSTSPSPTISLPTKTYEGPGNASFISTIQNLLPSTTYYLRAYATNNIGTNYGDEIRFTTYNADAISDIEGNYYNIITIGCQKWTAENLTTTRYNDGTVIPNLKDNASWAADITGAYCDYANTLSNSNIYGRLYNWYVVTSTNPRNICPVGWHVPSDIEWTTLTDYLINNGYGYQGSGDDIGKSIAATSGWSTYEIAGTLGNDQVSNNSSGFTALPGGYRNSVGEFGAIYDNSAWWSTTEFDATNSYTRDMRYDNAVLFRYLGNKQAANSIRCVKADQSQVPPTIVQIVHPTCSKPTGSVVLDGLPGTGTWHLISNPVGVDVLSTGVNYIVPELSPGSYTFTVTNSSGCTSSTSSNVVIDAVPGSPTIIGNLNICAGSTTQLTGSGTPAVINSWISSATSVATVNSSGLVTGVSSGTTQITYTNNSGCTSTATVTVTPTNTITLTSGSDYQSVCIGMIITNITYSTAGATGAIFNGLPPGVTGSWVNNVITISGAAMQPGFFSYVITLTGGCGSIAQAGTIYVEEFPYITGPYTLCQGSTITLTVNPSLNGGIWTSNAPSIASVSNYGNPSIEVTGLTPGNATIIYTSTSGCSAAVDVTVNALPLVTFPGTLSAQCITSTIYALAGGTPGGGTYSGPGVIGTNFDASIAGNGNHTITYSYTNGSGCTATVTNTIVVNTVAGVANQSSSILSGDIFTVTPSGVPVGTTYTWLAPIYTGSVSGGSAQVVPQSSISGSLTGTGTATYTVTPASGSCTGTQFTLTVTVSTTLYTISASAGAGGTIAPYGSSLVSYGSTYSYTISPDPGYQIEYVMVDNVNLGAINNYTFSNISTNHAISATFSIIPSLNVNPPNQNVPFSTGTTNFAVTSSVAWTASSDQTWCTVTPSGTGNGTLTATYQENTGTSTRTATIIVFGSGVSNQIVTLTQSGLTSSKVYQLEYISGSNQTYSGGGLPLLIVFKIKNTTDNVYVTNLETENLSINATASIGFQDYAFNNLADFCDPGDNSCYAGSYYIPPNTGLAYVLSITITLKKDNLDLDAVTITENITSSTKIAPPLVGTITDPTCNVATGSVVLNGLPSTGSWTLTRNPGGIAISGEGTSSTVSGLATGAYTYTVTNAVGATSELSSYVIINPQPTTPSAPIVTLIDPTCTVATGTITVTAPAEAGMTFSIDGSNFINTTGVFTNVLPGTYIVTARNSDGCMSLGTIATISPQPVTPTAPVVTLVKPTCTDPTFTLTVLSPSGIGMTYSVNGITFENTTGVFIETPGPLGSLATVAAKSAEGCISPITSLTIDPQQSSPDSPTQTIDCSLGSNNATVTVTSPTGTGLEYRLDAGVYQASVTFTGVLNGSHSITVRNASGCTTTGSSFSVSCGCANGPSLALNSISGNTCGTIPVTVSGNTFSNATSVTITENGAGSVSSPSTGTSPFAFSYTPAAGDAGNTVIITVTTDNPSGAPCASAVATYTLTVNAIPSAPVVGTITPPTCADGTGSVILNGLPVGNWTINPGAIPGSVTSTTIPSLAPSTYNFTVTNAAGCISALSANVVINPQPSSPASPTQTTDCSLGSNNATVTVTSPTGTGLEYRLDAGVYQASVTFTGVLNGSHSITVRNASGCTTTGSSFSVSCGCANGPSLALNSISGNTCGTIPVTVSGNTFSNATSVTITENGAGSVSSPSTGTSPFAFSYTPAAGDAGNTVIITVTTDNPSELHVHQQ